jgi:LysR family transcriptional regulator, hydrogen peroxide-inducible genes activator
MPTLRQLRYLVAIADTGSFRRAAASCHVTQPTLSQQLQGLEARLGVVLVERDRSRVALSPVGREVAERARGVLREVQGIVDLARAAPKLLQGRLRLGLPKTLGPWLLPHLLPALAERYPDLRLEPREGHSREIAALLAAGGLDLLLDQLPVAEPELAAEPVAAEGLLLAVPRDHPLASAAGVGASDLAGETVLTLGPAFRLDEALGPLYAAAGAEPRRDYAETSLDLLRQLVALGRGVTFLPALYVLAEGGEDPRVVALRLAPDPPERRLGLVWRRGADPAPFRVLARFARETLRELSPDLRVIEPPPGPG